MAIIIIGADLCPIEGNLPYFQKGDAQSLFHDLLSEFKAADLTMANLECPLIEKASPINKTGPTFGADPACLNGIKAAGIQVLCLANNHILDHGPAGLETTIEACTQAGIDTVGVGDNLFSARRILIRQIGKLRIGILAMAEREFSIASHDFGGANPLDLIDYVRNVNQHRSEFDYLIVLLHGAHEFQPISPRLKNTCHFLIEMGADAVMVQHPHSLGGYENYQGGHIVYGQGALVMDEAVYRDLASFHEGFLVKLKIADDASSTMEIVPFTQSDPMPGARKMDKEREVQFLKILEERSKAILDDAFVEAEWNRFCEANKYGYLNCLLGHGRLLRKLNKNGWLTRLFYRKKQWLGVRNCVSCETHREALETILQARSRELGAGRGRMSNRNI